MANLITHIVNQELPKNGFRKVAFYTIDTSNVNSCEYFLGTDNNPLDSEYIENLQLKSRITRLRTPVEVQDDMTLYSNSSGDLFIADYLNPNKNKTKINSENQSSQEKTILLVLNRFGKANRALKYKTLST